MQAVGKPKTTEVDSCDDTDAGTRVDEQDMSHKSTVMDSRENDETSVDELNEKPRGTTRNNLNPTMEDIEAEAADAQIQRIQTSASQKTHRSALSRLSRGKNQKEKPPPPPPIPITDLDAGVVGWDSQTDPEMPLNFTSSRKWLIIVLLSAITFMTPFASSILAPAITFVARDYGETNLTLASMPVSIFLLGYCIGPLFLSPLSEIYGRNIVLFASNVFFCVWLIGCALSPTLNGLIVFRFLSGVGGSACQTVGGGIVADMFPIAERGRAMTMWMVGPILGPSFGPLIGGFVSEQVGWRWVNWVTFIPATIATVGMAIFSRETNHQVLIQRKTLKLRRELNRPELRSCYVDPDAPVRTTSQILTTGLIRPFKMLFQSAIIFSVSLYVAFAYGCLYLLFNTIPIIFRGAYGWSIGISGLVYLSILVGYIIGLTLFNLLSDKTVVRLTAANNGVYEPEMRLPTVIWNAAILPLTFFWYGWAADKAVHWIVPILGLLPFSVGIIGIWLPIQAYLVDAYAPYAASCLAAFAVLRCAVAAFLPLAGPKMYETLGVGWGSSLLGFVAVAMIPIPLLIRRYGKWMRLRFPMKL